MAAKLVRGHFTGRDPRERANRRSVCTQENAQQRDERPASSFRVGLGLVDDGDEEEADRREGEAGEQYQTPGKAPSETETSEGASDGNALCDDGVDERLAGSSNLEEVCAVYKSRRRYYQRYYKEKDLENLHPTRRLTPEAAWKVAHEIQRSVRLCRRC